MPVYAPATLLEAPLVYLNGGKRGFLIELSPASIVSELNVTLGDITAE